MTTPDVDTRGPGRRARDEQIAAEPQMPPLELPPEAPFSPVETHLGRRRPVAVVGVVENGLVRPLDPAVEAKLSMSLAELNLSVRATNCLESENIRTVRDLVACAEDQLLEVRNFGETTLNEVREKLADFGLRLGMRVPAAPASPL